jgi:uncharacterized iron-regulated membrane protein
VGRPDNQTTRSDGVHAGVNAQGVAGDRADDDAEDGAEDDEEVAAIEATVTVDSLCGDARVSHPGQGVLSRYARPAHVSLMLGTPGKVIVVLAGLSLPMLYASGAWMWLRRRRRQRQR